MAIPRTLTLAIAVFGNIHCIDIFPELPLGPPLMHITNTCYGSLNNTTHQFHTYLYIINTQAISSLLKITFYGHFNEFYDIISYNPTNDI